jgi:hypothetical protein
VDHPLLHSTLLPQQAVKSSPLGRGVHPYSVLSIMSGTEPFSLATLGRELDSARRARTGNSVPAYPSIDEDDVVSQPMECGSSGMSGRSSSTSSSESETVERPFPLCLVCLSRPPTAVLLPCESARTNRRVRLTLGCHLNLCHLCAPLMIMRHRDTSLTDTITPATSSRIPAQPGSEPSRWNQVLARATASHPKSRRLSMGGYVAPEQGQCGAEVAPCDLLSSSIESTSSMTSIPETSRVSGSVGGQGRVVLDEGQGHAGGGRAKCLMCRAGVQGWLRVYPG